MLTAGQCRIVAYVTDGEVICRDCAEDLMEQWLDSQGLDHETRMGEALAAWEREHGTRPDKWRESRIYDEVENDLNEQAEKALDLQPLSQYSVDSDEGFREDGLWCECGEELVTPEPPETEDDDEEDGE